MIEEFGLSDAQSQAIVDMRLRALTGLERNRLENEYKELEERIAYLQSILGDVKVLLGVIRDELLTIKDKYGDDRKTAIELAEDEFNAEDLIPNEAAVIAMTKLGYIKRMSPDHFKAQNRGGKGIKGMNILDEDYIADLITIIIMIMFFSLQISEECTSLRVMRYLRQAVLREEQLLLICCSCRQVKR